MDHKKLGRDTLRPRGYAGSGLSESGFDTGGWAQYALRPSPALAEDPAWTPDLPAWLRSY